MSQPPVPPLRRSSVKFTKQKLLLDQRHEAERTRKAAQKSTETLASWESGEYWAYRKEESKANMKMVEIDRELEIESQGTNLTSTNYLKRKAEVEEETESAERKIRRYEARSRIVEAAKTTNFPSIRASYLELMLTLLTKTSRNHQSAFVKELESKYGHQKFGKAKHVWSPVIGDWVARGDVKAAHLFPLSLGQKSMNFIFGPEAQDEMNRAPNGLFLQSSIEQAFDQHQLIIVPCGEENRPQEWKFLILDKGGLSNTKLHILGAQSTFANLHERKLIFQPGNDFRPRARYLYFHYVMAMLKLGRRNKDGRAQISAHMSELTTPVLTKVWATQGRYLRQNMIRAFIEGIAHDSPEADSEMLMEHAKEKENVTDEMIEMIETAKAIVVESDEEDSDDD